MPALPEKRPRLLSLDALRGFDFLWIMGAESLVYQLAQVTKGEWLKDVATQLHHVGREGFHAYDLIFPLFVFLSGITIPLSLDARATGGDSRGKMFRKIFTRTAWLVFLGMVYNGLLAGKADSHRVASVLGQIGIAWGLAATLYVFVKKPWPRLGAGVGVLGIVAWLQLAFPVPGVGAGVFTPAGTVNAWIDGMWLPGKLLCGRFDPEGLLCVFSASAVAIFGSVLGSFLKMPGGRSWKCVGLQICVGGAALALGAWFWKLGYPSIKSLWTVPFVFLAVGWSLVLFAVFFGVIDVLRWQRWCFPLCVIGMNSLTIYFLVELVNFPGISGFFFGLLSDSCGMYKPVILAAGVLIIEWLVLYFLYRKKAFLRV